MPKKSKWYVQGYSAGGDAALDNLSSPGAREEVLQYASEDRLGEYVQMIREHQVQFAGDISYDVGQPGGPTELQYEQYEDGFTDGFIANVKASVKGELTSNPGRVRWSPPIGWTTKTQWAHVAQLASRGPLPPEYVEWYEHARHAFSPSSRPHPEHVRIVEERIREQSGGVQENPRGYVYEVIVGNIGTVYSGASKAEAEKTYRTYVQQSKAGYGRASGEDVTLMVDGEIAREHYGAQYEENPRKSHTEIVRAFLEHRKKSISHFATDGERLFVHDNLVAEHRPEGIYVTDAGWRTLLTKNVLNALMAIADGFGYAAGVLAQERGEWLFAPIERGVLDWSNAVPWTGSAILAPVSKPVGY
jgi:hypothetical protein